MHLCPFNFDVLWHDLLLFFLCFFIMLKCSWNLRTRLTHLGAHWDSLCKHCNHLWGEGGDSTGSCKAQSSKLLRSTKAFILRQLLVSLQYRSRTFGIELLNEKGWKRLLRSSSPTIHLWPVLHLPFPWTPTGVVTPPPHHSFWEEILRNIQPDMQSLPSFCREAVSPEFPSTSRHKLLRFVSYR